MWICDADVFMIEVWVISVGVLRRCEYVIEVGM